MKPSRLGVSGLSSLSFVTGSCPSMTNVVIRPATSTDEPFLWICLRHAAHEETVEAVQQHSVVANYVKDFGTQRGDMGWIASMDDKPVGAVWMRLWGTDALMQGFCYLGNDIPEIAFAVLPEFRGQGIGTLLLQTLLQNARGRYPKVCLCVRTTNPVMRLYARMGFELVEGSDRVNRTGGTSVTMVHPL